MIDYDLELEKAAKAIKQKKCKTVFLQLPDGLKPKAKEIADYLKSKTNADCIIWLGDCYGGCDIPQGIESLKADMIIQWGHNRFIKSKGW